MVFGSQKLQNEVFCLTEERDFFQGKYLEQVSELANLKEELRLARREIAKLRKEMLSNDSNLVATMTPPKERKQAAAIGGDDDQCSTASCSCSSLSNASGEDDGEDEAVDIRQSAEKLLQWASYRSSVYNTKASPEPKAAETDSPQSVSTGDVDYVPSGNCYTPSLNPIISDDPQINSADDPQTNSADDPLINSADDPLINTADDPQIKTADDPQINRADAPQINRADAPQINRADAPQINRADAPQINTANGEDSGEGTSLLEKLETATIG